MILPAEQAVIQCQQALLKHTCRLLSENGTPKEAVEIEAVLHLKEMLAQEIHYGQEQYSINPGIPHQVHTFGCECPQCEEHILMVHI